MDGGEGGARRRRRWRSRLRWRPCCFVWELMPTSLLERPVETGMVEHARRAPTHEELMLASLVEHTRRDHADQFAGAPS
jgi:hypothetical protein